MAETTTTREASRLAWGTICAARAIEEASPTEVPPNFITRTGLFISSGSGARQTEVAFCNKQFGVEDGRAGGAPDGVVAEGDEKKIENAVRHAGAHREGPAGARGSVQARLRPIELVADNQRMFRCGVQAQLLG